MSVSKLIILKFIALDHHLGLNHDSEHRQLI
jgi:hypothetical protein